VQVGPGADLLFQPNYMDANVGDTVLFQFFKLNHTLTQSTLERPCTPDHRFDSGFRQFNPTNQLGMTLSFSVNTFDPQWFFCRQNVPVSHCQAGMVFAINPGDQMDDFLSNARGDSTGPSSTTVVTNLESATSPAFSMNPIPGGVFPTPIPPNAFFTGTLPLFPTILPTGGVSSASGYWHGCSERLRHSTI
jgi:hypothetical protein